MNIPQDNAGALKALNELAADLGEHFESVRIFVTRKSNDGDGNSTAFDTGNGNLYAQYGQVWEWLEIQRGYIRHYAWKKQEDEE